MKIKHPLLLFISCLLLTACNNNEFRVKGIAKHMKDGDTLYVSSDIVNGTPIDTILAKKGRFTYSGESDSTKLLFIYQASDESKNAIFIPEQGEIVIELFDQPLLSRVSGTKITDDFQRFNDSIYKYSMQITSIWAEEYKSEQQQSTTKKTMARVDSLEEKINKCIFHYYNRNKNNAMGKFIIRANKSIL